MNRSKKKIRRLGIIQVKEPSVNSKYHIKILSQNRYDFSKASGVKVSFILIYHTFNNKLKNCQQKR